MDDVRICEPCQLLFGVAAVRRYRCADVAVFGEGLRDWEADWSLFPRDWCGKEAEQTIKAALARRKLDEPKPGDTMTPDELAALARVNRKSIMISLRRRTALFSVSIRMVNLPSTSRAQGAGCLRALTSDPQFGSIRTV
jgi:hypothetical protein